LTLFELKDFLYIIFIIAACWYSYRKGFIEGLDNGVDKSLIFLDKKGYITLTRDDNGNIVEFESNE
tara:strand:+ start:6575 stop:6772 length:198 start_codon:yes stop_codon:yes gene_type:complete